MLLLLLPLSEIILLNKGAHAHSISLDVSCRPLYKINKDNGDHTLGCPQCIECNSNTGNKINPHTK